MSWIINYTQSFVSFTHKWVYVKRNKNSTSYIVYMTKEINLKWIFLLMLMMMKTKAIILHTKSTSKSYSKCMQIKYNIKVISSLLLFIIWKMLLSLLNWNIYLFIYILPVYQLELQYISLLSSDCVLCVHVWLGAHAQK